MREETSTSGSSVRLMDGESCATTASERQVQLREALQEIKGLREREKQANQARAAVSCVSWGSRRIWVGMKGFRALLGRER